MRRPGTVVAGLFALLATTGAAHGEGFRLEKRFDLAPGGTFTLRVEAGKVTVRGGDGAQAVAVVTADREDFAASHDVRFATPPGRLEMVVECRKKGLFKSCRHGRVEVAVELPRKTTAKLRSSGGGIDVAGLEGSVEAESSGGAVHLADVTGEVKLSSSGGGITADLPVTVRGRVEQGELRGTLNGGGALLKLRSSGGGIRLLPR